LRVPAADVARDDDGGAARGARHPADDAAAERGDRGRRRPHRGFAAGHRGVLAGAERGEEDGERGPGAAGDREHQKSVQTEPGSAKDRRR